MRFTTPTFQSVNNQFIIIMIKLHQLLIKLNSLYQFYKSSHWLSNGINFYSQHKLFEELYEDLDDEIDALAELILAFDDKDDKLNSKFIADETAKITKSTSSKFLENIKLASEQELDIIELIDSIKADSISTGIYNHLCSIAQNHSRNAYLLSRIDDNTSN